MTEALKRVLDPCCGSRMFWFDRQHPDVVFGDQRHEVLTVTDRSHGNADGVRTLRIEPDVLMDFRALPYPDGAFKLVSFDPPHLVRADLNIWARVEWSRTSRGGRQLDMLADLIEPTACASAYGLCEQWQAPQQQEEARAA